MSILLILASCSTKKKVVEQPAVIPANIVGEWRVKAVGDSILQGEGDEVMVFENGGRFNADLGCNKIMGEYSYDSTTGEVVFGKVASTLMACPNMEVEDKVKLALTEAARVACNADDNLALVDKTGKVLLELENPENAVLPLSYLEGEWRIMRVAAESVPAEMQETPVLVFDIKAMKLGGSTGCNNLMASLKSDGNNGKLSVSSVATTRMACGNMAFETAVVRSLERVKGFRLSDTSRVLLTDANGMTLMEIMRHM